MNDLVKISDLSPQNFYLKKLLVFFPKKHALKKFLIFSQKKLVFQKRYIQNPGITEFFYILRKVYSKPSHNETFLYFQKYSFLTLYFSYILGSNYSGSKNR